MAPGGQTQLASPTPAAVGDSLCLFRPFPSVHSRGYVREGTFGVARVGSLGLPKSSGARQQGESPPCRAQGLSHRSRQGQRAGGIVLLQGPGTFGPQWSDRGFGPLQGPRTFSVGVAPRTSLFTMLSERPDAFATPSRLIGDSFATYLAEGPAVRRGAHFGPKCCK